MISTNYLLTDSGTPFTEDDDIHHDIYRDLIIIFIMITQPKDEGWSRVN